MIRTVLAGLTAAALLLVAEPAAATIPDPVRSTQWISATCATGSIIGAHRDRGRNGIVVTGEAKDCGNFVSGSFFAVAVYHVRNPDNGAYAEVDDARFYRKGESRPFGVLAFKGEGTEAVCLMISATKRLACAWVTVPITGPVTVTPLSVDHPIVAKEVEFGWRDPGNPGGGDKCGTCF